MSDDPSPYEAPKTDPGLPPPDAGSVGLGIFLAFLILFGGTGFCIMLGGFLSLWVPGLQLVLPLLLPIGVIGTALYARATGWTQTAKGLWIGLALALGLLLLCGVGLFVLCSGMRFGTV